ncbi:Breast cancer type 2 susceptibility protein-like [Hondaea fermentalgiana]|uniref:Breast cancer type 2 susceptibility protein-like n=1 Tax=Hondaea fermentalgiana TaxID=2315210 RepID=A0A2R5GFD1_9STRA|nr:Breast cancer type 2 susceptibility protein-like [Hondaea fermentalgiana]|eukprot:GBG27333.1 Breast cancer type 2 susceptibility protein-like [Hondaea fermentalgiana]
MARLEETAAESGSQSPDLLADLSDDELENENQEDHQDAKNGDEVVHDASLEGHSRARPNVPYGDHKQSHDANDQHICKTKDDDCHGSDKTCAQSESIKSKSDRADNPLNSPEAPSWTPLRQRTPIVQFRYDFELSQSPYSSQEGNEDSCSVRSPLGAANNESAIASSSLPTAWAMSSSTSKGLKRPRSGRAVSSASALATAASPDSEFEGLQERHATSDHQDEVLLDEEDTIRHAPRGKHTGISRANDKENGDCNSEVSSSHGLKLDTGSDASQTEDSDKTGNPIRAAQGMAPPSAATRRGYGWGCNAASIARKCNDSKKRKTSHNEQCKASLGVYDAVKRASRQNLEEHAGFVMDKRPSTTSIREAALELGSPRWLLALNAETSGRVRFNPDSGDIESVAPTASAEGTYQVARRVLLDTDGVDEELVTDAWTANHYRWIVWKLAAYQRVLGAASPALADACTLGNVVFDLKYRYDRELVRAERPALRKVLEKDAPVAMHMVLCVASIARPGSAHHLVLTDGWYAVQVSVDSCLQRYIAKKRISVGSKIHVCGAVMINNEEGVSPLEVATNNPLIEPAPGARPEPRLRLSQNCTFPAAWQTKLGFQAEPVLYKQLRHVQPSAGTSVPGLRAVLVRHFALLYCERDAQSGHWITRTAEEEDAARRKYEESVCQARDAIIAEHENSWEDLSQGSGGSAKMRAREAIVQRRRDAVSNALLDDPRVPGRREIKTKLRVLLQQPGFDNFAELAMWNPPRDFARMYPEGSYLALHALTVVRTSKPSLARTISLNAGKETRFKLLEKVYPDANAVQTRSVLTVTDLCRAQDIGCPFIDLVGVLVHITGRHAFLCGPAGASDIVSVNLGPHSALDVTHIRTYGIEKDSMPIVCGRDLVVQPRDPTSKFFACGEYHHSALVLNPSSTVLAEARADADAGEDASKNLRGDAGEDASENLNGDAGEDASEDVRNTNYFRGAYDARNTYDTRDVQNPGAAEGPDFGNARTSDPATSLAGIVKGGRYEYATYAL